MFSQKQKELQKIKSILDATIDYLFETPEYTIANNEDEPADHFHQHLRIQIEKYFQQRRLDRLQNRLSQFLDMLIGKGDVDFETFIKEKTGYTLDLLEGLRNRVNIIVDKNKIRTEKEARDIALFLSYSKKTSLIQDDFKKINALLIEFAEKSVPEILKRQRGYNLITEVEEKDGVEITSISMNTGPKLK